MIFFKLLFKKASKRKLCETCTCSERMSSQLPVVIVFIRQHGVKVIPPFLQFGILAAVNLLGHLAVLSKNYDVVRNKVLLKD